MLCGTAFGLHLVVRWRLFTLGYKTLARLTWLAIPIRLFMGLYLRMCVVTMIGLIYPGSMSNQIVCLMAFGVLVAIIPLTIHTCRRRPCFRELTANISGQSSLGLWIYTSNFFTR